MNRQYAFADRLDVMAVEQLPHFLIDELLVRDVAQTADVESSSFFDWFGPVLAGIRSCVAVKDERRSCCCRGEIERSALAVCEAGFEASGT